MARELATRLPRESWGSKFRRAREELAGIGRLEDAVEQIGPYYRTSTSMLSRLESLHDAPTSWRAREVAYIASVVYGLDPKYLGLKIDDVPDLVVDALHRITAA
jgi:hypothetical protein